MNAMLLAMFAQEARAEMIGASLGRPLWYPPVFSVSFARHNHLVAVLEPPGPLCFLSSAYPFEGAHAPTRFDGLTGAEITGVSVPPGDRTLHVGVVTRRDRSRLTLVITLFGSAGGIRLERDGTVVESIGRVAGNRSVPAGATVPTPIPAPFYLVASGRLGGAAPAVSAPAGEDTRILGPFDSALDACGILGRLVLDGAYETILRRIVRPARRKIASLDKLATKLEADLAVAAEHEQERRVAELLAAYQTRIPAGADGVELPDLYDPTRVVRVELDPSVSVHTQIEKRFRRAARLEKSLVHTGRRLDLVRKEIDELGASMRLLEQAASFTDALRLVEAIRAKFSIDVEGRRPAIGRPRKQAAEKTYRQIDLDAHWFVIVGRSNHENDEITFKVAAPADLWFHAHQVPGSHVVLKARGGGAPPARIIEQAASVAAHFSKARHSGLVPVIYTQRRYVRKFRGAQPGEVTCEREKMLMVPPVVPGAEDDG
jgi:predicted ribosome quality control (RQC) complex YloA/Tae2 family protein